MWTRSSSMTLTKMTMISIVIIALCRLYSFSVVRKNIVTILLGVKIVCIDIFQNWQWSIPLNDPQRSMTDIAEWVKTLKGCSRSTRKCWFRVARLKKNTKKNVPALDSSFFCAQFLFIIVACERPSILVHTVYVSPCTSPRIFRRFRLRFFYDKQECFVFWV